MKPLIAILCACTLIAGCNIGRGFKPPADANALEVWGHPSGVTQEKINTAMTECGYTVLPYGKGVDNSDNGHAARMECMFAKNFYFQSGWGGLCSKPGNREKLPACKDAPIRPRNGYYGN
jgi:hypothetical protein